MKWWSWSSVSQFWNPFLSSKLRLEEEIPHFCKVLNIQRFNSINMSTACLNVSVSEYPALRGMRKCFWNESSCFYLQQLFWSCLTHSVFTVRGHDISHLMSETLVRVVPEQTETKCEWIREQTPESWTWAACFPVPCDPLTDLTQQHTRISQSEELQELPSLPECFFHLPHVTRCDKVIDPNHGDGSPLPCMWSTKEPLESTPLILENCSPLRTVKKMLEGFGHDRCDQTFKVYTRRSEQTGCC